VSYSNRRLGRGCGVSAASIQAPLACAVAVILWGPNASSDKLRGGALRLLRKQRCNSPTSRLGRKSDRFFAVSNHPTKCVKNMGTAQADVRFTPKADIVRHGGNVRFVPKADIPEVRKTQAVGR